MFTKKIGIIVLATAAVIALCISVYLYVMQTVKPVITLTEDGFKPDHLVITEGQTVTFKTTTGAPFWPASNVHPTHTAYPDFDPREPIAPEDTWSFTFNKAGTYLFHDHIASIHEGQIIVKKKDGTRVTSDCSTERNTQCWEKFMLETLEKEGVESALNSIVYLSETEPLFLNDCHAFSHLIGEKAYKLYVEHDNFELTPATALCGYGFYHGFMETLLLSTGNIEEAREFCRVVDQKLRGKATAASTACYHGTGHGAIDGSDPTAWGDIDAMMEPGFKVCSLLATNQMEQYLCDTGVFNAIEILSRDPKYGITDLIDDPYAMCNRQTLARREGCYSNMLPLILYKYQNDIEASAAYINEHMIDHTEKAIDGHTINELVTIGLVFEFIRLHGEDPDYAEKGIALCRAMPEDDKRACFEGLGGGHLKYGTPGVEYKAALEFCENSALTENERDACYSYTLRHLYNRYDEKTSRMICNGVAQEYREKYCTYQ